MRHAKLTIMAFAITIFAVGCSSTGGKAAPESQPGEVKTEVKEAGRAIRDYTYDQKDDFVKATKQELADIQAELDRLEAKVERSSGAVKDEAKLKLAAVREKWSAVKVRLEQAEQATEATWDDVQSGFKAAYHDLASSFASARQWLSDKIEP